MISVPLPVRTERVDRLKVRVYENRDAMGSAAGADVAARIRELLSSVVDTKVEVGDAVVEIEGLNQRVAAISTFANAYCLNAMVAEAVDFLVKEGVHPPIWMSGNAPGGDEANARFIERFKGRIRNL